ncbi:MULTISPECIES: hypothetical protein [unclassified Paenibacillus]|uniref:hypothetical protein n=1 Tax=unclassified Paenibacillus TaxID=185978 RepID=UPI0008987838|nr:MULTISPECIES: hypothetical protein [unclassified Paenibacillus]OMC68615.1 hypothetical protein BK126_12365 [Paenibacillus sp. FSL H7-0326]SDW57176.1 hypothetical protein SAMN05518848_102220 [Paenibacillus sp. PDC88]
MKNIVHWCLPKKMWTSHTYKSCTKAPVILVENGWSVETKPSKRANPRGWVVTDHANVTVNPPPEAVSQYEKSERLIYDKENVHFNINKGEALLFDETGCHLLRGK